MLKKIIGVILTLTLGFTVLAGCNLFEQNTRKNYMQVVATIDSVEETRKVGGKDIAFKSDKKDIYKYELVSYFNQNAQDLIQNQNKTVEAAVNACMENLITQELIFIEADRMIAFKEIEWRDGEIEILGDDGELETVTDYTDYNRIKELVYDAIDSSLTTIRNEILSERGDDLPAVDSATVDNETTYPVKEDEKAENDETIRETEPFVPDTARFPGYYGDADTKALGRETMRRFIELLRRNTLAENNYSVTADDEKKFREDDEKINKVINEQGIESVYGMIFDTHYINVLLTRNAERQVKLERIQNYISGRVTVSAKEVQDSYNAKVESQKLLYADESGFSSAIKGGEEDILYFPNSRYFYVKHILLPFSDEQKASLTAYKNAGTHSDAEIKAYRDALVAEIKAYPHLNGEDDLSRPMTVDRIWTQIRSAMKAAEADPYVAERLFDDFIYLYNTDPGAFTSKKGYVLESELLEGESETYMKEFAEGGRKLKNDPKYRPGMILDEYVVTDYGVHIMYYVQDTVSGEIKDPSDWQTPARYKTYYDVIEESIKTKKENDEFKKWSDNRITYYQNIKPIYTIYAKRFKDLIEQ